MNLAEVLFEDVVFSRLEKGGVLFIPLIEGGWLVFRFLKGKNGGGRVFFRFKNSRLFKGECSMEFFLRRVGNFLLKGNVEKTCLF